MNVAAVEALERDEDWMRHAENAVMYALSRRTHRHPGSEGPPEGGWTEEDREQARHVVKRLLPRFITDYTTAGCTCRFCASGRRRRARRAAHVQPEVARPPAERQERHRRERGRMNFRPELAAAVMAGEKTVTRRLTSTNPRSPWWQGGCSMNVGQPYAVCPGRGKTRIGRVVVTAIELQTLGHLSDADARDEGFPDAQAFEDAFTAINGSYDPAAKVWRIEFEALPTTPARSTT